MRSVELDRAARAPGRRLRAELAAATVRARRSRSRAAPPRSTSRSSSTGSAPATRSPARRSRSRRARTRSSTAAPRRSSSTATSSWLIDPALLDEAITARKRAGRPRPRRDRGRPLRPVLRLRSLLPGLRATRRPAHPGRRRVARRDLPRRAARARRRRSRRCRSTATRSSRRAAAARWSATDEALVAHARKLSTQAREPAPHYEHTEIGFNYRLSNLLAAVGRAQLAVLPRRGSRAAADQRPLPRAARRRARNRLHARPRLTARRNCWLTCITVDPSAFGADREQIRLALEAEDIEARPVWKPMHLQPVFAGSPIYGGDVSARLFERGLCLPSGSALTDDDQDRVVATLLATRAELSDLRRRGDLARDGRSRRRRASAPSGRCGRSPCRGSLVWISRVTGPTPSSWSSTARTGVTSAAVPVMKNSSAR